MDKNRLMIIVILVLALGAVLSVVFLKNRDKGVGQEEPQVESQADAYTSSAKIKQVNEDNVILDIPILDPGKSAVTDIRYVERKLKIKRGKIEIVRRVTTNGVIKFTDMQLADLRPGMEVLITATSNPQIFGEFFGSRIEVIK